MDEFGGRSRVLYLSKAIGRPVRDRNDEQIGKVSDLIVAIEDQYPPVTGLVVKTDRRLIFLPWSAVRSLDGTGAQLATARIDIEKFQQRPNEILLRADLMDKQIVDIDGRKVVRVNDLRLDEVDGRLRLVAVDVGAAGGAAVSLVEHRVGLADARGSTEVDPKHAPHRHRCPSLVSRSLPKRVTASGRGSSCRGQG